ncbi:molybdopterin-binding protein [Afipia massiliensis]|uniref:Molybdopterin molybdenumtransferase n=1 Tax=Afipia massiliensis TaxID=211460 RepID=A0A4U6BUY3_9BRAD|nr:molybdopterin-binding protein [Afipia massiliensis]TKT73545.1 molybdopterin-binding protein [Afipia massiliensis]
MTQRLPAVLTPLDVALRLLLDDVGPVKPIGVSLADSVGGIAAEVAPLRTAHPAFSIAVADGWAMRARDIAGASSYSPLPLPASPVWVEAGDGLPEHCDCVLDADMVEQTGPIFEVLAEAVPGHGIRRAGDDVAAGRSIISPGRQVNARDRLALHAIGLDRIQIRSPRVCVIDVTSTDGSAASSQFIVEFVKAAGARAVGVQTRGRDAASISTAIDEGTYDLLITVGGTGLGRTDATVQALAAHGTVLAHGLALQPGRTAAVAKIGTTPVIAVPGTPDQALAVCLTLVQPALDLLTERAQRQAIVRPLARKVSSSIGVAEIVLLEALDDKWMPVAAGQLSLDAIVRSHAWLAVPGDSEGYAAGTAVGAFSLRDMT